MKSIIYTIIAGNASEYAKYCVPTIKSYAERLGSDFLVLTDAEEHQYPTNHFLIFDAFKHFENSDYDAMAFMDADIVINKITPNIFEEFNNGFWVRQGWDWKTVDPYIRSNFGPPKRVFPRYFSSGIVVSTKPEIKEVNTHLHAPWKIGPWSGDQGQLNYALTESTFDVNILPYRWHFTRNWATSIDAYKFGGDVDGAVREAGCSKLSDIYCMHYAGSGKVQQILNDKPLLRELGVEL